MDLKTFNPNGVGVDNGAYYGLPFTPEEAALVLVSAPWDVTVSYGAGTALAPDALIEASTQLDLYDASAPGAWLGGIATADAGSAFNTGVRKVSIMAAVAVLLRNIENAAVTRMNPNNT